MSNIKNKKNIAFLINSMANGGAERIISYLTFGFSDQEYNKFLIVDNRKEVEYECQAKCISLNLNQENDIISKTKRMLKRYFKVRKIKKQYKIEKTISFLDTPNLINILSHCNDKIIISVRNCMSEEKQYSYFKRKIISFLYQRADEIIAISEGVKLDLVENFYIDSEKIKVIYNSIDINKAIDSQCENIGVDLQEIFENPVILNAGRLTYQKGQWHLIKAFSRVVQEIPDAKLVILGEGELKEKFITLIEQLGIEESVHLIGYQKNPFKFIAKADIFVLSSLFEGFGNVILEAMACKTPVISTDCKYGPREILSPKTCLKQKTDEIEYGEYGMLIPCFDEEVNGDSLILSKKEHLLANLIISSLKNKELLNQYKLKGFERSKMFDLDNIIKKWLEF